MPGSIGFPEQVDIEAPGHWNKSSQEAVELSLTNLRGPGPPKIIEEGVGLEVSTGPWDQYLQSRKAVTWRVLWAGDPG